MYSAYVSLAHWATKQDSDFNEGKIMRSLTANLVMVQKRFLEVIVANEFFITYNFLSSNARHDEVHMKPQSKAYVNFLFCKKRPEQ